MSDMKGTPCISGGYANMMNDTDDLIRRSDALDCFHDWVDRYGDVHTPDEMAEYIAIEELPSVEPKRTEERTETRACDCISRQAAIDILDAYQVMLENGEENPYSWARFRMSELPSAQQDCTDCAEYDHERHYCPKYCDVIRRTLEEAKQERKTGRWIHDGYAFKGGIDWMHCSECGHKDSWSAATRTPFCAWCGARMEGE